MTRKMNIPRRRRNYHDDTTIVGIDDDYDHCRDDDDDDDSLMNLFPKEPNNSFHLVTNNVDSNNNTPRSIEQHQECDIQRGNAGIAKLDALQITPTCQALCGIVVLIMALCVFLSHCTSTVEMLEQEGSFSMTVAEQQVLWKKYLGSFDGSSFSNVKLPAGGNPIDLILLLKSRIVDK